jgi:hypothetical protein
MNHWPDGLLNSRENPLYVATFIWTYSLPSSEIRLIIRGLRQASAKLLEEDRDFRLPYP